VPVVGYRLDGPVAGGLGVVDGWVVATGVERLSLAGGGPAAAGPGGRIMPVAELRLSGRHNVANLMAAIGTAMLFGVAPASIRAAAGAFTGVEHRLERVAVIDGVAFVNDSQGTQPDAVIAALRAFEPPVVLIAGGRDKGVDLAPLAAVVAERAAAAVLIGESGPALGRLFRAAGLVLVEEAGSMAAAVPRAARIAGELLAAAGRGAGATVLLSPAAASFDQFVDYAERGRAFKEAVAALASSAARVGGPAAGPAGDPATAAAGQR
jgi:UDP-N-acetylmuramoylalanine--D-glutamate ligase